ncbi:hypothetical protein [Campylobacter fetus]|uniref:hypothetical protein n=1 Tax=Campylobacter fetus TaxID=196 RepID=UPI00073A7CAF|nr:hypothetical protein [Campylobacter fetus]ALV65373.1 hypothetical protein CFTSP3_1421 [Campylobacter fetus subsp. testudinum Sp3]
MKKVCFLAIMFAMSAGAWPINEASNAFERKYHNEGSIYRQLGQGKWECTDRYAKDSAELEWCMKGWEYMNEKLESKKRDW